MVYLSICLYHLWFLSSVSYNFLSTGLLPPWVGFFLGIFFIAMVNEIVSLIYLSDLSLLMYRNAEDFCPLIFYPENLSYSLVRTSHFTYIYILFPTFYPLWGYFSSFSGFLRGALRLLNWDFSSFLMYAFHAINFTLGTEWNLAESHKFWYVAFSFNWCTS